MSSRKWFTFMSAGVIAALLTTACGSSNPDSQGPSTPSGNDVAQGSQSVAPSESAPAKDLGSLQIATPGVAASSSFVFVARDAGIFKANGLDVTIATGIAPPDTPAALIRGSIQAAAFTGTTTKARAKGLGVVNVIATATHEPFVLLAAPGIKTLQDLVGKSIVTGTPTQTPGTQTANLVKAAGLTDKIKVVGLTSTAATSAMFISGQADAEYVALNQAITDSGKRSGSTIILDNSSLPDMPAVGLGVAQKLVDDKPEVVSALVKSSLQAAHMMKNEPDKAAPYIEKEFDLTHDQAMNFLKAMAENIVLTSPTDAEFANLAEEYSNLPDQTITWTAELIAKTWDTSFQDKHVQELGYAS